MRFPAPFVSKLFRNFRKVLKNNNTVYRFMASSIDCDTYVKGKIMQIGNFIEKIIISKYSKDEKKKEKLYESIKDHLT